MRRWVLVVVLMIAGCTGSAQAPVTVYAASSLTEVFKDLGERFEQAGGPRVEFAFAGSQTLKLQIEHGAPADIFATASESHLNELLQSGAVDARWSLVANELVAVVPADSSITEFGELSEARRLVVAAPNVPAGAYTRQVWARLANSSSSLARQLERSVVSEESNVRLVRSKVELGVADAGFVYRTDAMGVAGLRVLEPPTDARVVALYGLGLVDANDGARRFVEYLRSDVGMRVFRQYGFEVPR